MQLSRGWGKQNLSRGAKRFAGVENKVYLCTRIAALDPNRQYKLLNINRMKFNKVFSALALMVAVAFTACNENAPIVGPNGGGDGDSVPVTVDTLTVAQAIAKQDNSIAFVNGYIVGWYSNHNNDKKVIFSAEATADTTVIETNIVIADAADITDAAQCVCVQLPTGVLRSALNLSDHPENLKMSVKVKGSLEAYNTMAGVKSITAAWLNGKEISLVPEASATLTVAEAIEKANALDKGKSSSEYYSVKGVVSAVATAAGELLSHGNINFTLQDNTGAIGCYYINYLNNEKFTSTDQILQVGDSVEVISQLKNYVKNNNSTPELEGGYIKSIKKGSGETKIIDVTFAEAIDICNKLTADGSTIEMYRVKGAISKINSNDENVEKYKNCNFIINDGTNTTPTITCYKTNYLDNQPFTSVTQISVGQKVTVVGRLVNYRGTTPEILQGYIESLD